MPWGHPAISTVTRKAWAAAGEAGAAPVRAVVAEMIAHWERIGTTREEDELITEWRKRAELEET